MTRVLKPHLCIYERDTEKVKDQIENCNGSTSPLKWAEFRAGSENLGKSENKELVAAVSGK